MFTIELSEALCSAIDALMPYKSALNDDKTLLVCCEARLTNKNVIPHKTLNKFIYFILNRKYSRCIKVFATIQNKYEFLIPKLEEFKFYANHDSCWRSDGIKKVINETYFKLAESVQADTKIAPIKMDQFVDIIEIQFINSKISLKDDLYFISEASFIENK